MQYELQLLCDISENTDLIVPIPVRNLNNDFITEIILFDKAVKCTLTQWIDGRDLQKEDLSNQEFVHELGINTAKLHRFLRTYNEVPQHIRPSYGKQRVNKMLEQIFSGVEKCLFSQTEFGIVEQSLQLIASRLDRLKCEECWGIIHGDLNMSNILVTAQRNVAFIDFGLFGYGYYLMDVAMGALNSTSETRTEFLQGYFGNEKISDDIITYVEGFMLMSILGYYAFHMENEKIHSWITERMPRLCTNRCKPFLSGDRIFYDF